jgi:DNA-binding LacI/PurR family transcriptional regulator
MRRSPRGNPRAGSSPGMSDIARVARVSIATASLALNNHNRVSSRTKLRVAKAAARLGYVPNHAARRLARSRFARETNPFDQVGFVFFDRMGSELDALYLAMLRGAEYQLSKCGAALTFLRIASEEDRDKVGRLVKAAWVDGWLVVGDVDDDSLRQFQTPNRPCVVLAGHRCTQPVHNADIDFPAVGRLAAEHLASLGHRRIGYLGGSMRHQYQWDTLNGFRAIARERGMEIVEELHPAHPDGPLRPASERLRDLLALRPLPTAIVTAEHSYGLTALDLLRQYELEVPREISLLGCQLEGLSGSRTGLTRIEQPFSEVGRAGALLLKEVAARPGVPARQVRVSPVLCEGLSCGRPRNAGITDRLVCPTKESQS